MRRASFVDDRGAQGALFLDRIRDRRDGDSRRDPPVDASLIASVFKELAANIGGQGDSTSLRATPPGRRRSVR